MVTRQGGNLCRQLLHLPRVTSSPELCRSSLEPACFSFSFCFFLLGMYLYCFDTRKKHHVECKMSRLVMNVNIYLFIQMYLFIYLFSTEPTLMFILFVGGHFGGHFFNRFFIIAKCPMDEEDEGTADFQRNVFSRRPHRC